MAAKNLAGQFDKSHNLTCIPVSQAEDVLETSEEYEPLEDPDAAFEPNEHLKGWLTDSQSRDQILMIQGDDVTVDWLHRGSSLENNHQRNVSLCAYPAAVAFSSNSLAVCVIEMD